MATLADRNYNPGNLRDPKTGAFRKFSSEQEGYTALMNDLQGKITGATSTGLSGNSTLSDFAHVYAPSNENNSKQYTVNLANTLGVSPYTKLSELQSRVPDFARAIAKNEGYTAAKGFTVANKKITPIQNATPTEEDIYNRVFNPQAIQESQPEQPTLDLKGNILLNTARKGLGLESMSPNDVKESLKDSFGDSFGTVLAGAVNTLGGLGNAVVGIPAGAYGLSQVLSGKEMSPTVKYLTEGAQDELVKESPIAGRIGEIGSYLTPAAPEALITRGLEKLAVKNPKLLAQLVSNPNTRRLLRVGSTNALGMLGGAAIRSGGELTPGDVGASILGGSLASAFGSKLYKIADKDKMMFDYGIKNEKEFTDLLNNKVIPDFQDVIREKAAITKAKGVDALAEKDLPDYIDLPDADKIEKPAFMSVLKVASDLGDKAISKNGSFNGKEVNLVLQKYLDDLGTGNRKIIDELTAKGELPELSDLNKLERTIKSQLSSASLREGEYQSVIKRIEGEFDDLRKAQKEGRPLTYDKLNAYRARGNTRFGKENTVEDLFQNAFSDGVRKFEDDVIAGYKTSNPDISEAVARLKQSRVAMSYLYDAQKIAAAINGKRLSDLMGSGTARFLGSALGWTTGGPIAAFAAASGSERLLDAANRAKAKSTLSSKLLKYAKNPQDIAIENLSKAQQSARKGSNEILNINKTKEFKAQPLALPAPKTASVRSSIESGGTIPLPSKTEALRDTNTKTIINPATPKGIPTRAETITRYKTLIQELEKQKLSGENGAPQIVKGRIDSILSNLKDKLKDLESGKNVLGAILFLSSLGLMSDKSEASMGEVESKNAIERQSLDNGEYALKGKIAAKSNPQYSAYDTEIKSAEELVDNIFGMKLPKDYLKSVLATESSFGNVDNKYNEKIGENAWLMGLTKDAIDKVNNYLDTNNIALDADINPDTVQGAINLSAIYSMLRARISAGQDKDGVKKLDTNKTKEHLQNAIKLYNNRYNAGASKSNSFTERFKYINKNGNT